MTSRNETQSQTVFFSILILNRDQIHTGRNKLSEQHLHKQHYTDTITTQTQTSNTRRTPHETTTTVGPSVFGEDGGRLRSCGFSGLPATSESTDNPSQMGGYMGRKPFPSFHRDGRRSVAAGTPDREDERENCTHLAPPSFCHLLKMAEKLPTPPPTPRLSATLSCLRLSFFQHQGKIESTAYLRSHWEYPACHPIPTPLPCILQNWPDSTIPSTLHTKPCLRGSGGSFTRAECDCYFSQLSQDGGDWIQGFRWLPRSCHPHSTSHKNPSPEHVSFPETKTVCLTDSRPSCSEYDATSDEDSSEDASDTFRDIPATNAVKKAEGINNTCYIFPEDLDELSAHADRTIHAVHDISTTLTEAHRTITSYTHKHNKTEVEVRCFRGQLLGFSGKEICPTSTRESGLVPHALAQGMVFIWALTRVRCPRNHSYTARLPVSRHTGHSVAYKGSTAAAVLWSVARADLQWRSRLVRHWSGAREVLVFSRKAAFITSEEAGGDALCSDSQRAVLYCPLVDLPVTPRRGLHVTHLLHTARPPCWFLHSDTTSSTLRTTHSHSVAVAVSQHTTAAFLPIAAPSQTASVADRSSLNCETASIARRSPSHCNAPYRIESHYYGTNFRQGSQPSVARLLFRPSAEPIHNNPLSVSPSLQQNFNISQKEVQNTGDPGNTGYLITLCAEDKELVYFFVWPRLRWTRLSIAHFIDVVEKRGRSVSAGRAPSSHEEEPGSIPGGAASGFSHVDTVPQDAAVRRVLSVISPPPPNLHSSAAPYSTSLQPYRLSNPRCWETPKNFPLPIFWQYYLQGACAVINLYGNTYAVSMVKEEIETVMVFSRGQLAEGGYVNIVTPGPRAGRVLPVSGWGVDPRGPGRRYPRFRTFTGRINRFTPDVPEIAVSIESG
ncbi:hypothetical protein PR048_024326 [Dryococelus australis]|uniref:Uncharacterized protein n=1 Tax=Dryococelus australis TaxID=614101 RepID=A0ABQ9GNB4_9NEOP|nr:hypothetical protein PR048_024326 [Dryococelus australis]